MAKIGVSDLMKAKSGEDCPTCRGTAMKASKACPDCGGTGDKPMADAGPTPGDNGNTGQ